MEVIGEAVKNIPSNFKKNNKDVEWKEIAGLRDKLVHHYFGVDLNVVWDIKEYDLPELKVKISKLLKNSK